MAILVRGMASAQQTWGDVGSWRLAILRIGKSGVKAEADIEYGYLNF